MKKRDKLGIIIIFIILIAAISVLTITWLTKENNVDEPVNYSVNNTGFKDSDDSELIKKDLLNDATFILQSFYDSIGGSENIDATLEEINKKNFDSVPEIVRQKTRLVDTLDNDDMRALAYQALLATAFVNDSQHGGQGTISPIGEDVLSLIYLDQDMGIAQIPTSVFSGNTSLVSLEFVYFDGDWKFSPYSAIESALVYSNYSNNTTEK